MNEALTIIAVGIWLLCGGIAFGMAPDQPENRPPAEALLIGMIIIVLLGPASLGVILGDRWKRRP